MTTLEKHDRPSFQDLLWSTWPISTMALDLPVADAMTMRLEEFRDGDDVVVRAELPGIDPLRDLAITVGDGVLTIAAERREESSEGERGKPGYRSEFRYGSLRRVLPVPHRVRAGDARATYVDGILEVRLPLSTAPTAPDKVPVMRG